MIPAEQRCRTPHNLPRSSLTGRWYYLPKSQTTLVQSALNVISLTPHSRYVKPGCPDCMCGMPQPQYCGGRCRNRGSDAEQTVYRIMSSAVRCQGWRSVLLSREIYQRKTGRRRRSVKVGTSHQPPVKVKLWKLWKVKPCQLYLSNSFMSLYD